MNYHLARVLDSWVTLAEQKGLDATDLDTWVHDVKAKEATDINNGGLKSQFAFLAQTPGMDIDGMTRFIADFGSGD